VTAPVATLDPGIVVGWPLLTLTHGGTATADERARLAKLAGVAHVLFEPDYRLVCSPHWMSWRFPPRRLGAVATLRARFAELEPGWWELRLDTETPL
jgi:hypothetical protein